MDKAPHNPNYRLKWKSGGESRLKSRCTESERLYVTYLFTIHQAVPSLAVPFPRIVKIVPAGVKTAIQDDPLSHGIVPHGRSAALRRGIDGTELTPTAFA